MEEKIEVAFDKLILNVSKEDNLDVDVLHNFLLRFSAEKYLDLFRKMQMKIYGYPSLAEFGGCGVIGDGDDGA